jgi:hypothetical protein
MHVRVFFLTACVILDVYQSDMPPWPSVGCQLILMIKAGVVLPFKKIMFLFSNFFLFQWWVIF